MRQHLTKQFQYNDWANESLFAVIRADPDFPERGKSIFSHLLLSQKAWFERMQGASPSQPFWQDLSLEQMEELITTTGHDWREYVAVVPQHQFRSLVSYTNSKGESFANTALDIMAHLLNHSSHHRAQIVQLIRQSGHQPPMLDYIVYARSVAPPEL